MLKFHLFLIHLLSNLPCSNLHSKAYLKKSIHFQDFWQFLYLLLPRIKVVHILYIELCIKRFLSPLFLPMKRNIWSLLSQTKATFHHKWIFKAYENKTVQDNKSCTVTTIEDPPVLQHGICIFVEMQVYTYRHTDKHTRKTSWKTDCLSQHRNMLEAIDIQDRWIEDINI